MISCMHPQCVLVGPPGRYALSGKTSDNAVWMMGNPNWATINMHLGEVCTHIVYNKLNDAIKVILLWLADKVLLCNNNLHLSVGHKLYESIYNACSSSIFIFYHVHLEDLVATEPFPSEP